MNYELNNIKQPKISKMQYINKSKHIICNNCGNCYHIAKKCNEPISSYGMIILKINNKWLNKYSNEDIKNFFIERYSSNSKFHIKNLNIEQYLDKNNFINNINKINNQEYKNIYFDEVINNIEFCMIQRKHTVNYIQLIRGKYNELDIDKLIIMFSRLTADELNKVKNYTFDELWNDLWNPKNNELINEYVIAQDKFNFIKLYLNNLISKINTIYNHPEWEFPKGRRNENEQNIDCAIREFEEETGIKKNNIILLDKILPIIENIIGSNDKKYKMTYYIGILKNEDIEIKIDKNNIFHQIEISDVKFLSIFNSKQKIREFHKEKKNIIDLLTQFISYNIKYYDKHYKKFYSYYL